MDYSYVFLILLLPFLSFLVLGLGGMKMSHKVAGTDRRPAAGRLHQSDYHRRRRRNQKRRMVSLRQPRTKKASG